MLKLISHIGCQVFVVRLFSHVGCQSLFSRVFHILKVKCVLETVSHIGCQFSSSKVPHVLDVKLLFYIDSQILDVERGPHFTASARYPRGGKKGQIRSWRRIPSRSGV